MKNKGNRRLHIPSHPTPCIVLQYILMSLYRNLHTNSVGSAKFSADVFS